MGGSVCPLLNFRSSRYLEYLHNIYNGLACTLCNRQSNAQGAMELCPNTGSCTLRIPNKLDSLSA